MNSISAIASAILAELKPTLDQIKGLAASFLGQEQTKVQGSKNKKKQKKNKKK